MTMVTDFFTLPKQLSTSNYNSLRSG